ncbi:PLP-dependent aminotransferase family protein [Leekyejoonella antrihumi]|uniref:MocR-like pyridoxine biosynthesis transcription factor PdxR n=1 Tax=Leekyejoonella antrihumi TaxID=1660198 RepID=UPI001644B22C|nr:PLP-dependent aminotransferase family protein [Leekyejoonella antrihumi]
MPRSRRISNLCLDKSEARSVAGLSAAIAAQIGPGRLGRGDALPSTRTLAADLGVARSRVVMAYDELIAAGLVETRGGSGAVVAVDDAEVVPDDSRIAAGRPRLAPRHFRDDRPGPERVRFNLAPGAPDVSLIDRRDWRRAWRAASATVPEVDWYRPLHHPELQAALVTYLRRARGITAAAEDVVIFPGVSAAISAVADALGVRRAAMEDPGYPMARIPLQESAAHLDLLAVDEDGLRVDQLTAEHDLAYVTPAHQYPLGGRMPAGRRQRLLEWSHDADAVIIEDDFDGEFRHEAGPLGPLRAMKGGAQRVVYLGTASKILTPDLRIAWAVVPSWMSDAVRVSGARRRTDGSRVASRAMSRMMEDGSLTRHLTRAQRTYSARRTRLVTALSERCPDIEVLGVATGIHVAIRWGCGARDTDVVDRCAERGLVVSALSSYAVAHPVNGLLLGYAQLPETAARPVVDEIACVLEQLGWS